MSKVEAVNTWLVFTGRSWLYFTGGAWLRSWSLSAALSDRFTLSLKFVLSRFLQQQQHTTLMVTISNASATADAAMVMCYAEKRPAFSQSPPLALGVYPALHKATHTPSCVYGSAWCPHFSAIDANSVHPTARQKIPASIPPSQPYTTLKRAVGAKCTRSSARRSTQASGVARTHDSSQCFRHSLRRISWKPNNKSNPNTCGSVSAQLRTQKCSPLYSNE